MIQGKKILLTGGAGFIGTALCQRLHEHNEVVIFDNFRRDAIQHTPLADQPRVQIIKGDVRDEAALRQAMTGCHGVVHMASVAGVDTVLKNPVLTMEVSLEGTLNALKAAREVATVERFIDFSTSEVFGRYAYRVTEGDSTNLGAVGEARWTYAVSKLATEHLAYNYYKSFGIPTLSIRPFNIFGPGQVGEGAIHAFIVRALQNQPLVVHNDGAQIRSWCYIDDLIEGVLLCLDHPKAVGHAFNLGNPRTAITIHSLARLIVRLAESKSSVEHQRWDHPDVELRIPDVSKARDLLGFIPSIDLEDGLVRTIDWYRESLRNQASSTA
jgi:nucleoside-diphosphate-sugar epimerase